MPVYFIRMSGSDFFKIGYAVDPVKRLATLQRGCPYDLEIFTLIDGATRKLEGALHRRYKNQRMRGEWFCLDSQTILNDVQEYRPDKLTIYPTQGQLAAVLDTIPNLTDYGFYNPKPANMTDAEYQREFDIDRQALYDNLEHFTFCCRWLAKCYKILTFDGFSYGLKHDVERYYNTYITNGALIAAAACMGFRWRRCEGPRNPNANIAVGVPKEIIIQRNDSKYLPGGNELKEQFR